MNISCLGGNANGIFLAIAFLLASCVSSDRSSSRTLSVLRNSSGQLLAISVLKNGIAREFGQHLLQPSTEKKVLESIGMGIGSGMTFRDFVGGSDSVVVLYGPTTKVVHYPHNRIVVGGKAIPFDSPRNLFNRNNYVRTILEDRKRYFEDQYTYTFTQQDYQDALK